MKLLIATPTWGHYVTTDYFQSFISMMNDLMGWEIDFQIMTSPIDLISKARNKCAKEAIEGGYDRLLFIDSDIVWTPQDFLKLWNSEEAIIGGTYPFKSFPIRLNFHANQQDWQGGQFQDFIDAFAKKGIIEVNKMPTGFLMIKTNVLKTILEKGLAKEYDDENPITGKREYLNDFFPLTIQRKLYETEDWGFCRLAKDAGYKIYLHSDVILDHMGMHRFSAKKLVDQ